MQDIISLLFFFGSIGWIGIFLSTFTFFLFLYFFSASLTHFLVEKVLLPRKIGAKVDSRTVPKNQIKREIINSTVSAVVFAFTASGIYFLYRFKLININWSPSSSQIFLEIGALFLWNELHFYLCHRILHLPWFLKKVHSVHHRSVITTPFSTYSFHWFEAALLATVMPLALLFHSFSFHSLFFLPIISIFGNSIGHSNYSLFKEGSQSPSRVHRQHHYHANVNFGFLLPIFDIIFKTRATN